ncbi:hypothetical protein C8Q74DRAFT_1323925 [Fomes fomentarius]|nr:hypothetical protein C8Q74DRAFT_1323925 [Fomes fomentarius]
MSPPVSKNSKNYFLVNAPDIPNAQRAKHTPLHMQQNTPLLENGYYVVGAAILPAGSHSSDAGVHSKIAGSVCIVKVNDAEEVWETLKKDVFYTSGEVWDCAKITVTPVFIAFPTVE